MLLAIWGRDGIGKSMMADALGILSAKEKITAVIDTDLTQPTLPARINGVAFEKDTSLGKAVLGFSVGDPSVFLHNHPRYKNMFYAGLVDRDEYMSYEIGLEADIRAQEFVNLCAGISDMVILDISGQRVDPFIPCSLIHADKIILTITPDVQGVCWFNAVKPLIEGLNAQGRVLLVAAMADKHHDLTAIEKAADLHFSAVLPNVKEFRYMHDTGKSPLDGTTPAAFRYMAQMKKLYSKLRGDETV